MLPYLFLINGGEQMTASTLQELDITEYTHGTNTRGIHSTLQPKQYHLKHRSTIFGEEGYLNRFVETGTCFLESDTGNELYQTAFTVEEIDELNREYNVLFYFEIEEVTL